MEYIRPATFGISVLGVIVAIRTVISYTISR